MGTCRAVFVVISILAPTSAAAAVTIDGATIHWWSAGAGPNAVILVHGWAGDLTIWSDQVPELARTYRVLTVDLPGHGRSGTPQSGTLSMDLFARAIEAVREEAGVERAVLVGHSMGATVVSRYAQLYPERTVALVLVDAYLLSPEARRAFVDSLPSMTGPEGMPAREAFARTMFSETTHERVRNRVLGMVRRTPEATAEGTMKAAGDPRALGPDPIDVPALGIHSPRDLPQAMDGAVEFTKQLLPSLRLETMPETGHFPMIEKPAEFNELLLAFVDEQY